MNVRFLIDRMVGLQARLLAEVATSGGARAPLAELSDQIFIHLAEELDRRGISRKVSADMFGMALRAYQKKIQRLAKSTTENGTSLWQAVVNHLHKEGLATRAQILQRFSRDDEGQVRAVLFDLTESGLVHLEGNGPGAQYSLARVETSRLDDQEKFADLLWLTIFRDGPLTLEQILEKNQRRRQQCETALTQLQESGRVALVESEGQATYESARFEIAAGQDSGWEAAILDHYQALIRTILGVIPGLTGKAEADPAIGGYTYSLDVWEGHPHEAEVKSTLAEMRAKLSDLRKRVDLHNEDRPLPQRYSEYRIYGGQSVSERDAPRSTTNPPPAGPAPPAAAEE